MRIGTLDKFALRDKTALVTGGRTGIGFGVAESMADAGAAVAILARGKGLDDALAPLREINSACRAYAYDLSDISGIEDQYRQIEDEMGGVDILVNNAGINIRGRADEFDLADWHKVIDVNLTAQFALSKAWGRSRIERGEGGCVLMTVSLMAEVARPTLAAYAASKGGIRQLIKALAVDWAPYGIRSNGIIPGYILTEINRPLIDDREFFDWVITRTPLARWGTPEDIGPVAVFLASDAANFITGQIICVDGGWSASL